MNVDALGAAMDRALEHPFARLLEQLAPRSMAEVRAVRENLPETLSGFEARAAAHVGGELDHLLADALQAFARRRGGKR